jgi:hypothetical protein
MSDGRWAMGCSKFGIQHDSAFLIALELATGLH